ncbi:hypothetical protein FK531_02005 [Rhodococcus spelaei]|uniref:Lipoprotein n=1 Tax=Rhodococcus spelaei TaxID=2546320 RepID=A0A541BRB3_9NOCA|nr:LppA family lipoprotein [Rhodococcus spelaei]TQF74870.1 hypothetical protein FK531_02005 [Rhodococcus spelaei]
MTSGGRAAVVAVLAVAAMTAGAACASTGTGERVGNSEAARRTEILAARVSLEEAVARAASMGQEIRIAVAAAVPAGSWRPNRPPSGAGNCEGFTHTAGQSRTTGTWVLEGGIPDERWPAALAALRSVIDRRGYGAPIVAVDRRNDHALRIYGPDDAYLWFGSGANAVLDVATGCHLPDSKRPRSAAAGSSK